ncbi:MAG TPA: hypothetical protein PKY20_04270 [Methanothrix sp.]|nr:hypothetical protein [Methanothrix sp.]HQE97396.1 hypothetical protein [Methanothrix sp.]HUM81281.1 hypothetical protein [Methanothrix sp.]
MISEKDLVERSIEDMQAEASELLSEAERLKEEHEAALQKVMLLRTGSVESRPIDSAEAERLWQEAEELNDSAKESLRLSMEKRLRAADLQHRIKIHDQIQSMDRSDEVWREAAKAGRG